MPVVDRMMTRDSHRLFPEAWEDAPFRGQRHFAEVGKFRLLRWRGSPVFSRWAQCSHRGGRRERVRKRGCPAQSRERWEGAAPWL